MSEERYDLPVGWVEANFEQCFDIPKGPFIKIPQKEYQPEGKYPIIDQGSDFIAGYSNNKGDLFKGELPVIVFGDHTRIFKFVDFNFAIGADGTKILKTKEGIDPKYLYYYLRSIELPSRGYSRHYRYLRENKILLAPQNEQKRIVQKIENLLNRLSKTKEELAKIPTLLKKFRQSVLAKAFSGELTEEWRAKQKDLEPASKLLEHIHEERKKQLGKKYKESEPIDTSDLPELPDIWGWATLREIFFEIKNGTAEKQNDEGNGIPVSRIETIQNGVFDLNRIKHIKKPTKALLENFKYKYGDIVLSHINSKEHVGKTAIYLGKPHPFIHGMNLLRLRMGHKFINPLYIFYYFQTFAFRNAVRLRVKHAVNQVSINQKNLSLIPIPIAPLKEQEYLIQNIGHLFSRTNAIEMAIKRPQIYCEKLTQSILAKAFRGELVPQG